MKYIPRDIESNITSLNKEYSCLLITGPRQVEKSTVLEHLIGPDDLTVIVVFSIIQKSITRFTQARKNRACVLFYIILCLYCFSGNGTTASVFPSTASTFRIVSS